MKLVFSKASSDGIEIALVSYVVYILQPRHWISKDPFVAETEVWEGSYFLYRSIRVKDTSFLYVSRLGALFFIHSKGEIFFFLTLG